MKGYKLEEMLNKETSELKQEINNTKRDNKEMWNRLDAKWTMVQKDTETLIAKNKYEILGELRKFEGKMNNLQQSFDSSKLQIKELHLKVREVGVENETIKREAKNLIEDAENRLFEITQSIQDFDNNAGLLQEKLSLGMKESLLELRDLTLEQKYALKEISQGKKGLELVHQERMNHFEKVQGELKLSKERLDDARKNQRLELKNREKIWRLEEDLNFKNTEYRREKERADYWSKQSKKKPSSSKYNFSRYDDFGE